MNRHKSVGAHLSISSAGICLFCFCLSSCDSQPPYRTYTESIQPPAVRTTDQRMDLGGDPAVSKMLARSSVNIPLSWDTPPGWTEESGSGMRLATFETPDGRALCTLIVLGGDAGGVKANLSRWLRQLRGGEPSSGTVEKLMDAGVEIPTNIESVELTLYDFSAVQDSGGIPGESVLGAIGMLRGQTIFLKMTGSRNVLSREKPALTSLIRSLRLK